MSIPNSQLRNAQAWLFGNWAASARRGVIRASYGEPRRGGPHSGPPRRHWLVGSHGDPTLAKAGVVELAVRSGAGREEQYHAHGEIRGDEQDRGPVPGHEAPGALNRPLAIGVDGHSGREPLDVE